MNRGGPHTCMVVSARDPQGDGKCATCRECDATRRVHEAATGSGHMQILRCSYCDGEGSHKTIRGAA